MIELVGKLVEQNRLIVITIKSAGVLANMNIKH